MNVEVVRAHGPEVVALAEPVPEHGIRAGAQAALAVVLQERVAEAPDEDETIGTVEMRPQVARATG